MIGGHWCQHPRADSGVTLKVTLVFLQQQDSPAVCKRCTCADGEGGVCRQSPGGLVLALMPRDVRGRA